MLAACALPLALRQRVQWQYRKPLSGGVTLNLIAPHRQLPFSSFAMFAPRVEARAARNAATSNLP
jgi:hypothetical protein